MATAGAVDPMGGRRTHGLPWALLVLTNLLAVATLARCFTGPGELAIALPACLLAHLLAGGGRRLAARPPVRSSRDRRSSRFGPLVTAAGWLLALVVAFLLPLSVLEPHTLSFGIPLTRTWHAVHGQLAVAWSIFSDKIAPVVEAPGLVLVTAWAAGAVALASEVLYADPGLPAILALVPAFDVIVFSGTLGTATGRALELAAVVATALSFLLTAQTDRRRDRRVVRATADVAAELPAHQSAALPARSSGARRVRRRPSTRRLAVPGLTLVAAVAAGVVGPALPGATSPPLIAWHGLSGRGNGQGHGSGSSSPKPNRTYVSNFVQVAEQEIENSGALLFTVHSAVRVRETLVTLDHFDGNSWSRSPAAPGQSTAIPQFTSSISSIERRPPAPFALPGGAEQVEQAIDISSLGGRWLPSPGVTDAVDGLSGISSVGSAGPISSLVGLTSNLTYAVKATVPPFSASLLSGIGTVGSQPADVPDLQLPQPIPSDLVRLAYRIAGATTNPYLMAERLQDYFLAGHGYVYHLPSVTPSGAIANTSQSYEALKAFLFTTRTGYCQQYATAFAVLARILGLPTRIAVGFLPGKEIAPDTYAVTGSDVHAWPEVDFGASGWVTFEPTPGVAAPGQSGRTTSTTVAPGAGVTTVPKTRSGSYHFLGQKGSPAPARHPASAVQLARQKGSSDAAGLVLAFLLLALGWVLGVPSWRILRRRRDRRDTRRATIAAWRSATWALAAAGAHRRRAETHLEFVQRVGRLGVLSTDAVRALEQLAHRVDRALYAADGPGRDSAAEAAAAWAESKAVRRSARRRISIWQQASSLIDPRDLLQAG